MDLEYIQYKLWLLLDALPLMLLVLTLLWLSSVVYNKMSNRSCVFCELIGINSPRIIYQEGDVVVMSNRNRFAIHHFLVISKQHIPTVRDLLPEHRLLVKAIKTIAMQMLEDEGYDSCDMSLGFHWPPTTSVSHLHLHAMAPRSSMGLFARLKYKHKSWWYVSPENILKLLENSKTVNSNSQSENTSL